MQDCRQTQDVEGAVGDCLAIVYPALLDQGVDPSEPLERLPYPRDDRDDVRHDRRRRQREYDGGTEIPY